MVASVVVHYQLVEFWSQKAWVFPHKGWGFLSKSLGFCKFGVKLWEKIAILCWNFVQYDFFEHIKSLFLKILDFFP